MLLINSKNLNCAVEQGVRFARNTFAKSKKINFEGIKYAPLRADTVELSSKISVVDSLLEKLPQISAMRESGMTQDKIAECLGVNRGRIQIFLKKYLPDVSTESIKFREAAKQFLSAGSEREQNKAFEAVDEVLQKIAKERAKSNKSYAYEDCLQDLRLKFIELAETRKNKPRVLYEQFLQELKAEPEKVPDKLVKVSLRKLDEGAVATSDLRTRMLEANDFCDGLINQSDLSDRQNLMAHLHLIDDKSVKDLSERFSLSPYRVKGCLREIFKAIKPGYEKAVISSDEYLQHRTESAQNVLNKIIAKEVD